MRILWHSNAAHCATGYGVQTGLVVPRLQALGHDLAISALWGVQGGLISIPGPRSPIAVYPRGYHLHGEDVVGPHALHHQADVVVTHYDAWTIDPARIPVPWVPWFPVDAENGPGPVLQRAAAAAVRLVQSHAGERELHNVGLDCLYVPAGYEPGMYYPDDGSALKESLGAAGKFLVGMIAANKGTQPCRKAFPQAFEGFGLFHKQHPDSVLYVHAQSQSPEGLDLVALADHYGIGDAIRFANPYGMIVGYDDAEMRQLYSAFDVLLAPSMGEGFGVPILEAQACGTGVITGGWTAMPEITRSGYALPKESAYKYHFPAYGDWWLARPESVAEALSDSVGWSFEPARVAERVAEYQIDRVLGEYWVPAMNRIAEVLAPPPAPNRAMRRKMKFADKQAA